MATFSPIPHFDAAAEIRAPQIGPSAMGTTGTSMPWACAGLQDLHHAALEGLQLSVAGDRAFGKNGEQIALAQHLHGLRECVFVGRRVFLLWCDGNGLGQPEQPAEPQAHPSEDAVIHDEADRTWARCHQQHGIDEAHVIADEHRHALGQNLLAAASHRSGRRDRESTQATKRSEGTRGHQHEDVERDDRIGDAGEGRSAGS